MIGTTDTEPRPLRASSELPALAGVSLIVPAGQLVSVGDLSGRTMEARQQPQQDMDHFGFELVEVSDSYAAKLTIGLCGALVTFFLVWAALVQVEEKVTGTGVVEIHGNIERIEHSDGGLVKVFAARTDDVLAPGALILQFDTPQIEREALSFTARIETLEDELVRVCFLMRTDGAPPTGKRIDGDPASEAFWSEQELRTAQGGVMDAEENRLATQISSLEHRTTPLLEEQTIILAQLPRRRQWRGALDG